MARPIKETPILTNRDAVNFFKLKEHNESVKKSKAEMQAITENAQKMRQKEVQPLNPNANAIKVVKKYKAELKSECEAGVKPFGRDYYNSKIYALNHILKLLQS